MTTRFPLALLACLMLTGCNQPVPVPVQIVLNRGNRPVPLELPCLNPSKLIRLPTGYGAAYEVKRGSGYVWLCYPHPLLNPPHHCNGSVVNAQERAE